MKQIRFTFISLFVLLLSCSMAFAAGTVKVTSQKEGKLRVITIAWTSDASGDVSSASGGAMRVKSGTLFAFAADPETGVSDLYDTVLNAEWTIIAESARRTIEFNDFLGGQGANLSNSANGDLIYLDSPQPFPTCKMELIVSNAGNAQSGTFVLFIWEE